MDQLHVMFFPFMAHGHTLPITNMAVLVALRGVKTTIITTPLNAHSFAKAVERTKQSGNPIALRVIKFPSLEVGLPEGYENTDQLSPPMMALSFFKALPMLREPLEHVLLESQPNCLVADMFFPWATDVAAKFNIPRVVFHSVSFFALSASVSMRDYKPFRNVSSDAEPFVVPNLPHEIKLTRTQVHPFDILEVEFLSDFAKLIDQSIDSETTSYGVIVNSFYELEPEYARHYREVLKRKAWHIGPLSLCNKDAEDNLQRGKVAAIDMHECLNWLDSKKPNSVIYICFGSTTSFASHQLYEIAMGVEASDQDFIWVVGGSGNEEWLPPQGFEERMKGKGLIIRGWAPQLLILDHEAVGGFVTHCGWNSVLEGVSGGKTMVTWPIMAEQFYNEKLVTHVLKIGVPVGAVRWSVPADSDTVKRGDVEKAVKRVMVGEEAKDMRRRAKALKEMAKRAIEEGGSSHSDLNVFIDELCVEANKSKPYQVQAS